jgi:Lon-like ATP-dependent protease
MLYGRLDIQSSDGQFQLNSLKPEFIKLNIKVILLGDPEIYLALWSTDEDFHKMFKVHAQFDTTTKLNTAMITNYARFFSLLASEEGLLHCDRGGAAALIEWAVAFAETQEQISLQFSYVADMMREADHYARAVRSTLIRRAHVQQAIDQRQWRSNRVDQDIREQIRKGTMLIDVTGTRVGQINGLTVYSTGIISFGKPSRITCTVSAGNAGIINIEREVDLSGAIHNKGVLILSGLLRSLFSRSQPISFTSSIAFEQSYGGVDGDSASVTEMIALLSAISNIPITQALAITGSINQKGDIQPIGGVNEKITGFYEVCKDRGLTGAQGVIIPKQNVKDLMLNDEIIEAVKQKKFAIYPVETVSDAVELMMGVPAGRIGRNGAFPEGTVYAKVQHNLDVLHEASRSSWLGPAKA